MKQIFGGAPPPGRTAGSPGGGTSNTAGAPPAPKLDSSGARSDSLVLSWQWPSAPRGQQFELCWRESHGSGAWQRQRLSINEAAFTAHVLRPLTPNTQYSVAVQVTPSGPRGAELVATTAPAVPQQLEVCDSTGSAISLRWRPVAGSSVRYAVYGSAALSFAKVYSGVDTFCEVSGLTRGKEYGFRVCAMNAHGGASDFSPELLSRCEPGSAGGAKSGARAHGVVPELLTLTHDALSMRWAPPAGGASNYIVELAEGEDGVVPDEEEWTVIYEGAPPGCEISYLAPATEYHMRVACTDAAGRTSDFGSPLIVTTPDEPEKKKKPKKKSPTKESAPAKRTPPPPKPPPKAPPRAPPSRPPPSPRHSSPGKATGGNATPRSPRIPPPRPPPPSKPPSSPRRTPPGPTPGYASPRKAAVPRNEPRETAPSRETAPTRSARRPPPPPRPQPSPRRAAKRDDDTAGSDSDSDDGGRRSPRRTSSAGGIHERLFNLHEEKMEELKEKRQQVVNSLSLSTLSLREKAGGAMSPRSKQGAKPFGSTATRPHLWLGATAAAGPTTDSCKRAGQDSPRGSRVSQVERDESDEPAVPDSPGPGAYNVMSATSGFKADLRKDPSKGSSSAFKSQTRRLFDTEGGVIDAELFPGKKVNESPGPTAYTPTIRGSIAEAAIAVKRHAEKIQNLRRSSSVPPKASFVNNLSQQKSKEPGPGAYEPGKVTETKLKRVYKISNSPFRSGSRRQLPWGGSGNDAPSSTRARKADEIAQTPFQEPGPGDYQLPGSFDKAKEKPRQNKAVGAWTKGAPRFAPDIAEDKLTPSAVHYTPNYNGLSTTSRV